MDDEKLREEFPGNSYTNVKQRKQENDETDISKERTPKGRVREKKKTIGERIAESFLATDKEAVGEHILFDWVVPGIKTIVEDIVHMLLYGDTGRGAGSIRRIGDSRGEGKIRRVPYDSIYDDPRRRDDAFLSQRGSRKPELVFSRRTDAEQVKAGMREYIEDYGRVTMKEFYNIVFEASEGEIDIPTSYTQTRYGWRDASRVQVIHVREGWLLDVPRAEVIER